MNTEKGINIECLSNNFDFSEVRYCENVSSSSSFIIRQQYEFLFKSLLQKYDNHYIIMKLNKDNKHILFLYFVYCFVNNKE